VQEKARSLVFFCCSFSLSLACSLAHSPCLVYYCCVYSFSSAVQLADDLSANIHLDQKKMENAPNPKVPAPKMGSLSLLDMHPLEIARQITLMGMPD
jgi:hypothetical protein